MIYDIVAVLFLVGLIVAIVGTRDRRKRK